MAIALLYMLVVIVCSYLSFHVNRCVITLMSRGPVWHLCCRLLCRLH